jgi:YbgC/YbaW family acyl-CoA thioester hydrolase
MPFSMTRRVQFSETDMARIVHFSNYFRWMEEVEHAFFRSVGLSVSMQHDGMHVGWPRVSVSCDYFGPVKFEDELELRLRVGRVGEKSFSYEVDFIKEGRVVALGKTTSVCCEIRHDEPMRSIAIPQAIRDRLAASMPTVPNAPADANAPKVV